MPYLHQNYYYRNEDMPAEEHIFLLGYDKLKEHPLLKYLDGDIYMYGKHTQGILSWSKCPNAR